MTVLHVVTTTTRRGAETFAAHLDSALGEMGVAGRVVALHRGDGVGLDVPVLADRRHHLAPRSVHRLRTELQRAGVAVAHGSSTLPATAVASLGVRTPWVYRSIGDPRFWSARGTRRLRVSAYLRRADAVVVLWPQAGEAIAEQHGIDPSRIHAIPNAVPTEDFPRVDGASRLSARAHFGLHEGAPVVLYAGALSPEKQVDVAIRSVGQVPDALLMVVGDGPEAPRLRELADRVAAGRVHFVGSLKSTATAMAAADVLVLPSQTEGIPAVLIEAGLSGLPVVATDVGGIREVVVDGVTGWVVEPGDVAGTAAAIERALRDDGAMGTRARDRCLERFDLRRVASAWEAVLTSLAHR